MLRNVWKRRELVWLSAGRELRAPHRNQSFGRFWVLWNPLFYSLLVAVVYNFVFGTKFGGTSSLPRDYPTFVLSGLLGWLGFSTVLIRSSTDARVNANLIRQVVYPIETITPAGVLVAMYPMFVGHVFLSGYLLIYKRDAPWTLLLLPLIYLIHGVWVLGLGYLIFVIGAFFPDTKEFISSFVIAGIYLLPVIYVPGSVPKLLSGVVRYNPIGPLIRCYQDAMYFGRVTSVAHWFLSPLVAIGSLLIGVAVFRRLRSSISAVL